jgi:ketosteroid isomerase-like protein
MLEAVGTAQHELQQGRPELFKALWSHSDDATLAGGLGGPIVRGWENVSQRLDWAASQFSQGRQTKEVLVSHVRGDMGYVVQLEHLHVTPLGETDEVTIHYRVTMVFRREGGEWRIVHRHADQNVERTPLR